MFFQRLRRMSTWEQMGTQNQCVNVHFSFVMDIIVFIVIHVGCKYMSVSVCVLLNAI